PPSSSSLTRRLRVHTHGRVSRVKDNPVLYMKPNELNPPSRVRRFSRSTPIRAHVRTASLRFLGPARTCNPKIEGYLMCMVVETVLPSGETFYISGIHLDFPVYVEPVRVEYQFFYGSSIKCSNWFALFRYIPGFVKETLGWSRSKQPEETVGCA